MKRLFIVITVILVSTITSFAFDTSLDVTGDITLSWQSAEINNYPVTYGLSNSKTDVDLNLDISKKYDNTKVGLEILLNPSTPTPELITIITYDETSIPANAINTQGPETDLYGREYWTYQILNPSLNLEAYGYVELDFDVLYVKAQTDKFTDHIETNLLEGYGFAESPGLLVKFAPIPDSLIKVSAGNGHDNKINAIIQGEYINSYYALTDLSGGIGGQFGDKEAFGAWAKVNLPDYNATLTAEYGIQKELSALGIFANYKGFIESNISFMIQDYGFISGDDDTIIFGDKIAENNAEDVILAAAFRKKGYKGFLGSFDTTMNIVENIRLGIMLNMVGGDPLDEELYPVLDTFSYKFNILSALTEDLALNFWYAGWGNQNITSIEGILYFNEFIDLSIGYQMKELYDFEDIFTISLTGKF